MFNPFKRKKRFNQNNNSFSRDNNDYSSNYGNGDYSNNYNSNGNSGNFNQNYFSGHGKFNKFRNGMNGNNHSALWITLLLAVLVALGVWAKNTNHLGAWKNNWLNSPFKTGQQETIRARMGQAQAQLTQVNRNLADSSLVKNGHTSFKNGEVNNPVLLTNYFEYIQDMYSFGKVYSIFYFSNTDADNQWINGIKQQRNQNNTKIMTFNGNLAQKNDGTFIYRYFYHNYDVPKSDKKYGKVDGYGHPFMALFVNGVPQNIIVDYKDFNGLMNKQNEIQTKVNKQENNYNLPDQHVGLAYPDYGKAIEEGKAYFEKTYQNVKNGITNNSNSSSVNSSSSNNTNQ